ncbi:MAG: SDR family NAD(P)-dependent oxidoreductase [Acidimicrobiia bacterium]
MPVDRPDCRGRVALVTGASRGIGAAIAERLAAAGASVAVTARTLDETPTASLAGSLRRTVAAIEACGASGFAFAADLTDADERARIVPAVEAALGPVDILVNNAAAAIYAPGGEMPLRRRELLFEVNVHAPIDLAQAVLPGMRARHAGWIVNISSATSAHPTGPPYLPVAMGTTTTPYGAAKAALERFTTGLAAEVFDAGIAVNALAPVTGVLTEGAVAVMGGRVDTSGFEPVEQMAEAAAYLASCPVHECTGRLLSSGGLLREIGRLR